MARRVVVRLAIVLVGLVAVLGGIFAWKYGAGTQAQGPGAGPQVATVAAAEVSVERWRRELDAVGSVSPVNGVDVTTEIAGTVAAIRFRSGSRADAGELLVELDDSVDQAELAELKAALELAEQDFARAETLIAEGTIPRSRYDEAKAELDRARARVQAKQAMIDKMHIRAPFAGTLGIRQVDVGEYVQPGTPLVALRTLDPVHVDFSLPEHHVAAVADGQAIELRVRAHPGRAFEGEITAIDRGVDRGTRTFALQATVPNPERLLRPGMFAEVTVLLPGRERVLTVPRTAISYAPYGDSAFVIREGGAGALTVQRRQVTVGETRRGEVEIVEGLEPGERVVEAGHQKLRNGQRIAIENAVALDPDMAVEQ